MMKMMANQQQIHKGKMTISSAPPQMEGNFTFHNNLGERVVQISENKIRVCLMTYLAVLKERGSWIAPAGILVTITLTLSTTDFKDRFLLTSATWQAIFILCGVASFVWLIYVLYRRPKETTIDDIVEQLIAPSDTKRKSR
jgi:hypothetical protein